MIFLCIFTILHNFAFFVQERAYAVEGASEARAAAEKAKALETAYFK